MAPLTEALEALYALARKRAFKLNHRCECCTSEQMVVDLKAKPLRALSWLALEPLAYSAMGTFGTAEDLLHALPRLLEVTSRGSFDRELVVKKVPFALPSAEEKAAFRRFLREEAFDELVRDDASDVLELIASHDLSERAFALAERAIAPRWYAQLVCELGSRQARGYSRSEAVLVDMVFTAPRLQALEEAFFRAEDRRDQQLFSTAIQVLEWF